MEISNGVISPDAFAMPPTDSSPFALHLVEGSLLLFWAASQAESDKWVNAFRKLEI